MLSMYCSGESREKLEIHRYYLVQHNTTPSNGMLAMVIPNRRLIYYLRGYFNGSVLFCLMFCSTMVSNFSFPASISFFSEYLMLNFFSSVFYVGDSIKRYFQLAIMH
ncbi:unnamed protein product [Onchocerca ochengi]|uniref:Uncharacterized protein n=1 Tax=Onchocerca ochengi TaxID=42157 RepID=A0A182DX43_ONCOC|nr:unnamed protein product [Onchocerca ochengi]